MSAPNDAPKEAPESGMVDLAAMLSSAPTLAAGTCGQHGPFESLIYRRPGHAPPEPLCPSCERLRLRAVGQAEARRAHEAVSEAQRQERFARIGLPERMLPKRYADFSPPTPLAAGHLAKVKAYADGWPETKAGGANLILCGKPGTGKTHLATMVCKQVASRHDAQPLYATTTRMLRHVRASYGRGATYTEQDAVERFSTCDLLVLDEVGVKLASENDRALLFEIIDERYQSVLPTILISNLTVGEIANQTDERLVDRLIENGQVLLFDWSSHRGGAS